MKTFSLLCSNCTGYEIKDTRYKASMIVIINMEIASTAGGFLARYNSGQDDLSYYNYSMSI